MENHRPRRPTKTADEENDTALASPAPGPSLGELASGRTRTPRSKTVLTRPRRQSEAITPENDASRTTDEENAPRSVFHGQAGTLRGHTSRPDPTTRKRMQGCLEVFDSAPRTADGRRPRRHLVENKLRRRRL